MPMRDEHLELLELAKTREDVRQLQASWACGEWASTVAATLAMLGDAKAMARLQFGSLLEQPDAAYCQTFFDLLVGAASQRAWNMSMYCQLPPHQWASLLHRSPQLASHGFKQMRSDAEIVAQAWEVLGQTGDEARSFRNAPVSVSKNTLYVWM